MRLKPTDRKAEILNAALTVAARPGGWSKLTREAVAREAKCADALVSKYFGTMIAFKRTIMRHAIKHENLPIVAQGLATGDDHMCRASPELRARALATLAG